MGGHPNHVGEILSRHALLTHLHCIVLETKFYKSCTGNWLWLSFNWLCLVFYKSSERSCPFFFFFFNRPIKELFNHMYWYQFCPNYHKSLKSQLPVKKHLPKLQGLNLWKQAVIGGMILEVTNIHILINNIPAFLECICRFLFAFLQRQPLSSSPI